MVSYNLNLKINLVIYYYHIGHLIEKYSMHYIQTKYIIIG